MLSRKPAQYDVPVLVRWIILCGLVLRFIVVLLEGESIYTHLWIVGLLWLFLYNIAFSIADIKGFHRRRDQPWYLFQIIADTVTFSILYLLTGAPDSDLFLSYVLPLYIAVEYFPLRSALILSLLIFSSFSAAIMALTIQNPDVATLDVIIRSVLPRGAFFLFILILSFLRGKLLQQETEILEAVHATALRLSRDETIESRLEAVIQGAISLLNAKGCKVYLRVPNRDELRLVALRGINTERLKPGYLMPFHKGVSGWVIRNKKELIENNYRTSSYRDSELQDLFEAVIAVPLLFDEEPIGVISVFDDVRNRTFSQKDFPVLKRLAQFAAVAIHDAQLVDRVQRQSDALQVLNAAGQDLDSDLDLSATYNSIAKYTWQLAVLYNDNPPLFAYLSLDNDRKGILEIAASYPPDHLSSIQQTVDLVNSANELPDLLGENTLQEQSQLHSDITSDLISTRYHPDTRSKSVSLIKKGNNILGVISLEHAEPNAFSEGLQENIDVLATQAAAAIDNVQNFEKIQTQRVLTETLYNASANIILEGDVAFDILRRVHQLVPYHRATLQHLQGQQRIILAKNNLDDSQVDPWLLRPVSIDRLIQDVIALKDVYILDSPVSHPDWQVLPTTEDIVMWIAIPLVYNNDVMAIITMDLLHELRYDEFFKDLLRLFGRQAASVLQNAEQLQELSRRNEALNTILDYLEDHRNLATIGLIFGESIHFATNRLGMALTIATDIAQGAYGHTINDIKTPLEQIKTNMKEYLEILNETRDEALESPTPVPLDLHKTLDRVLHQKRMNPYIKVIKNYYAVDPLLYAPDRQLRQVFFVLIQNALAAMNGKPGQLTIETKSMLGERGKYVQVSISDSGKGIPASKQQDIFEISRTADPKPRKKGIGIGLVWAYSFLRTYGGTITFQTSVNQGTTFYVAIPQDFRDPIYRDWMQGLT